MLGISAEKRHSPVRCPSGSRRGEGGQARDSAPCSSPVLRPQRQGGCRAEAPESGGAALGRAGTPSVKQVKWGVCRRRKATRLALNFAAPVTNKQIQTRKDRSHLIPACSAAAASLIGAEVIYLFDFSPPLLLHIHTPPHPLRFYFAFPPPSPAFPPLPHAAETVPVPSRRAAWPRLLCGRRQRRVPGEGRARRGEAGAEAGGSGAAAAPLPGDSGTPAGGAPGCPVLRTGVRGQKDDPHLASVHRRDGAAGQGDAWRQEPERRVASAYRATAARSPGAPRRRFAAPARGESRRPRCGGSGLRRGAAAAVPGTCARQPRAGAGVGAQEGTAVSPCAHTGTLVSM